MGSFSTAGAPSDHADDHNGADLGERRANDFGQHHTNDFEQRRVDDLGQRRADELGQHTDYDHQQRSNERPDGRPDLHENEEMFTGTPEQHASGTPRGHAGSHAGDSTGSHAIGGMGGRVGGDMGSHDVGGSGSRTTGESGRRAVGEYRADENAGAIAGGSEDYRESNSYNPPGAYPTDNDEARGNHATYGKPSAGDKLRGAMENAAGKMTGNAGLVEKGQDRKAGELSKE